MRAATVQSLPKKRVHGEPSYRFFRMHWDHEPTPNPSQEGNGQDADERLLPSWEGSGVGRFMEESTKRFVHDGQGVFALAIVDFSDAEDAAQSARVHFQRAGLGR